MQWPDVPKSDGGNRLSGAEERNQQMQILLRTNNSKSFLLRYRAYTRPSLPCQKKSVHFFNKKTPARLRNYRTYAKLVLPAADK